MKISEREVLEILTVLFNDENVTKR